MYLHLVPGACRTVNLQHVTRAVNRGETDLIEDAIEDLGQAAPCLASDVKAGDGLSCDFRLLQPDIPRPGVLGPADDVMSG